MKNRGWLIAVACLATSCMDDGVSLDVYKQATDESKRLQLQVEELKGELEEAKQESPTPGEDTGELKKQFDELLQDNETKDAELEKLKKDFRDYKSKYRLTVREKILGKKVARLTTTKNETYEDVVVREITPVGLRISHKDGTGRIRFEHLDKKLQDQLGYDEEEAAEILQIEIERKLALAQRAAAARKALQPTAEERAKSSRESRARDLARLEAWLAAARINLSSITQQMWEYESKERYARYRGRVSYWGPRAAEKRRQKTQLETNIISAKREIALLRSELD